jgi:hypothetical protein
MSRLGDAVPDVKTSQQPIILSTKQIEDLYASMASERTKTQNNEKVSANHKQDLSSPELATQFLSRFGFKGPNDIARFLNSPAGDTVKEKIGEELSEIAAIKDHNQFELQEKAKLRHRLAALFLLYMASKSSHAKDLRAYIEEEIEKHLQKEEARISKSATPHKPKVEFESPYNLEAIQHHLDANAEEAKQLDDELEALENIMKSIDAKYDAHDEAIEATEQEANALFNNKGINELSTEEKANIEAHIDNSLNALKSNKPKAETSEIEPTSEQLDHEQEAFMDQKNFNYKEKHLLALKAVVLGHHKMYDMNFNEVHHPDHAHLFMPESKATPFSNAEKRIAHKDGQFYLLRPSQELDNMSHEEKHQAKQDYRHSVRPELHAKPSHYAKCLRHDEKGHCQSRMLDIKSKQCMLFNQRVELQQQLQQAQAWKASAELSQQLGSGSKIPDAPSTNHSGATASYRTVMQNIRPLERQGATETNNQVKDMRPSPKPEQGKKVSQVELQAMMCSKVPDVTMQEVVKGLDRVNGQKPAMEHPSKAPTPFSTRPDPLSTKG